MPQRTPILLALADQRGQDLVEYALLILFIAAAVVGALGLFGGSLQTYYNSLVAGLPF